MRRALAGLLALAPLLLLPALPARAAPVQLDVAAVAAALPTQQVYRAPGAIAQVDLRVVLPLLGPEGRVVLAPPLAPGTEDAYPALLDPLAQLARVLGLHVLLVTGLDVSTLNGGTVTQSDLGESRETLAYRDVTEPLRFAARFAQDPGYVDDVPAKDLHVKAPRALVEQVVAGLTASPRYVAPGVAADLGDGSGLPTSSFNPPLKLRVAALPVLTRGQPYPDLAPALEAAFPGEVVIVLRGSWIEATGPDPIRLESARNYLLGVGRSELYQQAVPAKDLVLLLLQRLSDLQDADPFGGRAPLAAAARHHGSWVPEAIGWGVVGLLVLGGVALIWFGPPRGKEPASLGPSFRAERARVYLALSTVSQQVGRLRGQDPYLARAAERHDTAIAWLERADATGDPQALRAAGEAVAQADIELRRIGLS